jgi:large subunit ribosomal protein L23
MKDATSVLLRPVVSEKSYRLMQDGAYVFVVSPEATSSDVRRAVEETFGVHVKKVNTLNRKGKLRRNRRTNTLGRRMSTRRAVVTLVPGDRIDLFEQS